MTIVRHGVEKAAPGAPRVPYARAVEADGWMYVSGQVGFADGQVVPGGIAQESRQALENVITILREAGYGPEDVVRVGVWLHDARDFAAFNRVYLGYFGEHLPARACLESRMMISCLVEVDCVAYRSKSAG